MSSQETDPGDILRKELSKFCDEFNQSYSLAHPDFPHSDNLAFTKREVSIVGGDPSYLIGTLTYSPSDAESWPQTAIMRFVQSDEIPTPFNNSIFNQALEREASAISDPTRRQSLVDLVVSWQSSPIDVATTAQHPDMPQAIRLLYFTAGRYGMAMQALNSAMERDLRVSKPVSVIS